MSASECVQELLERIAARVGVDARVERKEDAEGVSTEFVGQDLGLVIGHHGGHEAHPFCSMQEIAVRPPGLPREGRGDSTCSARHYTSTRRPGSASPLGRGPEVRHHCPCSEHGAVSPASRPVLQAAAPGRERHSRRTRSRRGCLLDPWREKPPAFAAWLLTSVRGSLSTTKRWTSDATA